ncbi:MAG: GGDEF domain-containing protein [Pseudomonadota bacterium]
MAKLIDHIAALTSASDFDALDAALAEALLDLLDPASVSIFCTLGEAHDKRWFERVRLRPGAPAQVCDPLWLELDELPPLASMPQRLACLGSRESLALLPDSALPLHRLLLPLMTSEQVTGVVELTSGRPLPATTEHVFSSLHRSYRNSHAQLDASGRDGLTGLQNRQAFGAIFSAAAWGNAPTIAAPATPVPVERRHLASSDVYWLGLIDLDHFKGVNAQHGHLAGDALLVQIARLLADTLRYYDRLYRFGGGEFVLLLRCPDTEAARVALQRFRARLAATDFAPVGALTASAGFTMLMPEDLPSGALARAERALFAAKDQGRDRVVCDADLPDATLDAKGEWQ